MNWEYVNQFYKNKIHFYNQILDKLFFMIVTIETKLTKKKQQKLQQDEKDLDRFFRLIILFLKSLAFQNTFEYFKMKKIILTDASRLLFNDIFKELFKNVLQIFITKIKNEQDIDFTIN